MVFIFLQPRVQATQKLPPPFRAASLLVLVRIPGQLSLHHRQTNPAQQTSRIAKQGKEDINTLPGTITGIKHGNLPTAGDKPMKTFPLGFCG